MTSLFPRIVLRQHQRDFQAPFRVVGQRDAEGAGGVSSVCVATLTLVPARGIAQFESVVPRGDEVEYSHAQSSVSLRRLDHHIAGCCIERLRRIAQAVAGCVDCHVD